MARGEVKETTLLVLDENERTNRSGKKEKTVLRVVQWNNGRPMLEKRDMWRDGRQWKAGKAKGLNIDDFHLIAENWEDVISLLEGEEPEEVEDSGWDDDDDEEEEARPRRRAAGKKRSVSKKKSGGSKKKKKSGGRSRRPVLTQDDDDDDDMDYGDDDDYDDFDDYDE